MITGWVVRLALSLALLGLVLFEAGSPWVARVQLDGIAHETARQAYRTYERSGSARQAQETADTVAAEDGATVTDFAITKEGEVALTLTRTAPSVVLGKWDKTKSYYEVSVDALGKKGL